MDDETLFRTWMGTDQDEEMHLESSEYQDYAKGSEADRLLWLDLREYQISELLLDDLNWIRRMLMEKSGRGTGYIVKKYHYPDYFSGLSIWIPDGWAIEDYLSRKLWEGESIGLFKWQDIKIIQSEAVKAMHRFELQYSVIAMAFGILAPVVWAMLMGQPLTDSVQQIIVDEMTYAYKETNADFRVVALQLQYFNQNDVAYYAETLLNYIPFIGTYFGGIDEIVQLFINIPYPVWENVMFENTTPNIVITQNWKKCVRSLDIFFGAGGYSEYDPDNPGGDDPDDPIPPPYVPPPPPMSKILDIEGGV